MTWAERIKGLKVGDPVRISDAWQKACKVESAFIPLASGVIVRFEESKRGKIAVVDWDLPHVPERVNVANLTKISGREVG